MISLIIRAGIIRVTRVSALLTFSLLIACASGFAQIPSWEWVANGRLTGTPVFGGITTYGIGVDNGGNVYFGGSVADPSVVGATTLITSGSNDIFLAKTNSSGAIQWAKTYGTANWDQIVDMVTDTAGNLYAMVFFGSPSFNMDGQIVTSLIFGVCVAKFDANGICTAAKTTLNITNSTGGMDYSPLGFIAVANFTSVCKVNMNCDTIWTRRITTGLNASVQYYDVSIDPSGNIIACGTFGGSAVFGPFTLTTPSTADLDNFVVKYNTNGTVLWAKQFGLRGVSNEVAFSVATDNGGHTYVHGHYMTKLGIENDTLTNSGPFETIYLAKYSPTGEYEWSLNGTSTNQNFARQVICDADNDIWLAFNPSGTVNFAGQDHIPSTQSGTMIVSIDTSGTFKARLKPSGIGLTDPKRLVFNKTGTALYVGGYHLATDVTTVSFGFTTLNTSGCYIAKGIPGITTSVHDDANLKIPSDFALAQNYPNPFNPSTTISYSVTTKSHVTIEIFNVVGQKIRTLVNTSHSAGEYQTDWDGTNDSGDLEASGVYYYRLRAGDAVETKKMVLLK